MVCDDRDCHDNSFMVDDLGVSVTCLLMLRFC